MKVSRAKFVAIFLVSAFVFQFISNSVLGTKVGLFPVNGDFFPGTASAIGWKSTLATILYPVKIILVGPLASSLFKNPDPDPAPPIFVLAFAFYWTAVALILHYLLNKIFIRKKI
ncbi:hypothetical protein [Dyadobacter sp. NIV53]|uniref:hypothetical protein n=1 Tax=Dyadobacter sp. NIV53 TaxID=2861765 RepID=UPI001C86D5ED|nr:hypothetical protein [Dyadobacter sp. NIV53]